MIHICGCATVPVACHQNGLESVSKEVGAILVLRVLRTGGVQEWTQVAYSSTGLNERIRRLWIPVVVS